jgi:predicted RND superfamily exporter protein
MPLSLAQRIISRFHHASRNHLEWIFRVTTTRPRQVLCVFLLALVLSGVSIATIRFDTDIFRLFPTHQPALRLLLDSLEWSGSAGEAYFLLEGDKQALPAEAARFAERLHQARVDGQPAFKRITWQVFDESQAGAFTALMAYAVTHPQVFVTPADLGRFKQHFEPAAMDESLLRLQSDLAGQFGGAMTTLAAADPLFLRDLILPRLKAGSQALDLDPASPYFVSRDGRVLIMIAEPVRPVQDMVFARKLVVAINEARRGAAVSISCTGAHISAVLDEQAMKSNVLVSIVSSLLVVLGIFYAAYRRILPTLLIPIILVCGVVLALGCAGLFIRSIHIISFAFTALITGIGTDYSIHLYDRFHSERAAGKGTEEALRLSLLNTGYGVFTAAITTALPFLALCVSDVRALSELGLLVGLGVVFSLYASLFFLPPLLIFMEQRYPITYRPIPGLGLRGVWRLAGRRPGAITVLTLLLTAGLCWAAFHVGFDGELKNLQPRHSEAFLAQERIEQHLSLAPKQMLVAMDGQDLAPVLARAARVEALTARLQARGEIVAWSSLGRIINGPSAQAGIAHLLRAGFAGTKPEEAVRSALEHHGFSAEAFRPFLDAVGRLGQAEPVRAEEAIARLAASPLRGIADHHLVKDATGYHAVVYLHYRGPEFNQPAFLAELAAIDPTARATSVDLVSGQLTDAVKKSFIQAFLIGGTLVLFLLLVHFLETPTGVFYSMFPVLAGSVCMLGVMTLTGMRLNFMNAMVLVTILGMGSDFGLYIRFRVCDAVPAVREGQFVQIGRSVLLSAMTTIVGFGSLAFTDYGAMSSIGWATNLGVGFTTLFALVTLPAVMALRASLFKGRQA